MKKSPERTRKETTQTFNDGVIIIYGVTNVAKPGYQPVENLKKKCKLRYEERRLGIKRIYLARQNQAEVIRVLRVPRYKGISSQDLAATEDGEQYRIDTVQSVTDSYPESFDLSLVKVKQNYEVIS